LRERIANRSCPSKWYCEPPETGEESDKIPRNDAIRVLALTLGGLQKMAAKWDTDTHSEALLNMAREYRDAANVLFDTAHKSNAPTYQLYTHVIELALKAFLRARAGGFPKIHDVVELLKLCTGHGFKSNRDLKNVTGLLQTENEFFGFRYFNFANSTVPEISYVREVAENLLTTVTGQVKAHTGEPEPAPGAVVRITVSKPVSRLAK
jgi:HEPN domain-containing protein